MSFRGNPGAHDFRPGFALPSGTGEVAASPEPYRPSALDGGDTRHKTVDSGSSARLMVIGQKDVQGGIRQDMPETYRVRTQ